MKSKVNGQTHLAFYKYFSAWTVAKYFLNSLAKLAYINTYVQNILST